MEEERKRMPNQRSSHNTLPEPEPKKPRMITTDHQGIKGTPRVSEIEMEELAKAEEASGVERMKRHRMEVAGRVWIPETWGQESFLKEWVDCSAFDGSSVPNGVVLARRALVEECRRASSAHPGLTIGNLC